METEIVLLDESPERCMQRLTSNGKRCTNESVANVPYCNNHIPEGTNIQQRYSTRLAPTFKKVFDGYTKSSENPHDLTAEVGLMRTLLEQSLDIMNQAIEKGDPALILSTQRYLKQTIKETSDIVNSSANLQQKYEKMIPVSMVAAVVYQLIECVKIATNNDGRILEKLAKEIEKVRLPQVNMVTPWDQRSEQEQNSQKSTSSTELEKSLT